MQSIQWKTLIIYIATRLISFHNGPWHHLSVSGERFCKRQGTDRALWCQNLKYSLRSLRPHSDLLSLDNVKQIIWKLQITIQDLDHFRELSGLTPATWWEHSTPSIRTSSSCSLLCSSRSLSLAALRISPFSQHSSAHYNLYKPSTAGDFKHKQPKNIDICACGCSSNLLWSLVRCTLKFQQI